MNRGKPRGILVENTTSKAELDKLVQELKSKPEYKILEKGQGIATKVFGLETSSVKAFNKMVDEQGKNLSKKENKMK
ncbi:hypothetical protein [Legionella drancourtii]|uniref:hypothetical protein n=1 Tax=Legionella drancourtii TaxID=168933 RepID=UPI0001B01FB1|nr:hypothetical protein [Legionella drancourtii]